MRSARRPRTPVINVIDRGAARQRFSDSSHERTTRMSRNSLAPYNEWVRSSRGLRGGTADMLEQLPEWVLGVGVAIAVAAFVQLGARLARSIARGQAPQESGGEGIGAVVGALLGLLAFMLAFAFGMAAERRTLRVELLLDDVNSIGTTYLRAGMIPEPHRSASRDLLREYVDLRLEAAEHLAQLPAILQRSADVQRQLWSHAETLADADLKNPDIAALYVDSLNRIIELQTARVAVGSLRIPSVVWITFAVLIALTSLAVGYNFGKLSDRPCRLMTAMLAISLAIVIFLIFDLDRGNQGWLKVDQRPMVELRDQIALPRTGSTPPAG